MSTYISLPQSPTRPPPTSTCVHLPTINPLPIHLTTLVRVLLTTFALIAIITLITSDLHRYAYHGAPSHGHAIFALIHLFLTLLGHVGRGTYYVFTTLVRVQWRAADEAFGSEPEPRTKNRRVSSGEVAGLDGWAALGILIGAIVVIAAEKEQDAESIVGVVFALLTSALHAGLAIMGVRDERVAARARLGGEMGDGVGESLNTLLELDEDVGGSPVVMKSIM